MPMPHRQPALGSKPRLYRLIHDTAYYTAGTVVCLDEADVTEVHHERIHVTLEAEDAEKIAALEAQVEAMTARLDRLDPPPASEPTSPLALPAPEVTAPAAPGEAPPVSA